MKWKLMFDIDFCDFAVKHGPKAFCFQISKGVAGRRSKVDSIWSTTENLVTFSFPLLSTSLQYLILHTSRFASVLVSKPAAE